MVSSEDERLRAAALAIAQRDVLPTNEALALRAHELENLRAGTEIRYRALMASANDAILILDAGLNIVEANRAAWALFAVEGGDLVGRSYLDLVVPEEREAAGRKYELVVEHGLARIPERRMLRGDGTPIVVDILASLVRFGAEEVTFAVLRDVTARNQSEVALRESQASLRRRQAFLEMASRVAHMGGWAIELPHLAVTWSDEVRVIHEVPADYVPSIAEGINFCAPEYRDAIREAVANSMRDGTPWDLDLQIITAKGRRVWVRSIGEAERDQTGAIRGIHGALQDISGPKRAAEEARVVAERLASTLESITEAFVTLDRDWRFTYLNSQAERFLQRRRGDLLGSVIWTAFPEARGTIFESEFERALAAGVAVDFEVPYPLLGAWLEVRAYRYDDGLAVYFRDVSEKRRAGEALRGSEKRYRLLFDATPHAMWVYDPETLAFLEVNDAAVRRYRYSREEFLSMTIRDIRPPEDVPRLLRQLADASAPATHGDGVWRHRLNDGEILEVEIESNQILHLGKSACLVLATDVTEKRRLELQLLQSQKMEAVGQLAGGVAHDFNNLLGVISGYTELLRRDLGPGHPSGRRVDEIAKAADRAAALTRQLLAFSRKQVLQPKVLDLNHVVADIERMLRRLIGEDIEFTTVFGSTLGRVRVDPGQIEQVVMNLAVNARDAMPGGGRLVIETSNAFLDDSYTRNQTGLESGEYVLLAVSDTGHGMDPATAARVFEPFFTTKDPGKGTGLGLSTIYGIVKQSSGHIAVYSEPGHGTTFKIYLPSVDAEVEPAAPSPKEPAPRGTETVLLIEDAEALRMIVREILEDAGYNVMDGTTTDEALALAAGHQGPIHLVLTDVIMPGASGPEVVGRLKVSRPRVRVLFMSGYTHDAIGHHGLMDRGTEFIQKPFTADALRRKIRDILDAPDPDLPTTLSGRDC